VQVGYFKEDGRAYEAAARLAAAGIQTSVIKFEGATTWYRVQTGRFKTKAEATRYGEELLARKLVVDYAVTEINASR